MHPCGFNISRILNQLSNYADVIAGERNEISLNVMAEPCAHSGESKDFKMEDETEAEKSYSKDDMNYNKNKSEDWWTVAKNWTKVKRKECKVIETKNQHKALKDDEDEEEEAEDEKIADAERNFDMMVILSIAYFCTTNESEESACDNKQIKLKKENNKDKMEERKAI